MASDNRKIQEPSGVRMLQYEILQITPKATIRSRREPNTLDVAQAENLCRTKGEEWKQWETTGNKGRRTKTGQTGSQTQSQVQGRKIDCGKLEGKQTKCMHITWLLENGCMKRHQESTS
ncbi:hypothetical protein AV530_017192 [Patagioenas fasciata monilis]|uniref:Uncharacterized protein n=1 Tax=Patagioenas fasciata monilis TaxID=372326 RepID=A0A1V4JFB2_PATFA|nr:hypothetical protein AV530_017192 [Patagioenas fasciata monilis]